VSQLLPSAFTSLFDELRGRFFVQERERIFARRGTGRIILAHSPAFSCSSLLHPSMFAHSLGSISTVKKPSSCIAHLYKQIAMRNIPELSLFGYYAMTFGFSCFTVITLIDLYTTLHSNIVFIKKRL
jgi:hypothetical protein